MAVGTFAGGPIGDKIGRKAVIWVSFIGMAPFALMMPYANLFWTTVFSIIAGLVLSSAFAAMVVYAQEAVPGRRHDCRFNVWPYVWGKWYCRSGARAFSGY